MSKESIRKITDAEEKAREIVEAANQRAKAMFAETEQQSKQDREQLEAETSQRLRQMLDEMRAQSEEILRRSSESAQKEAERMTRATGMPYHSDVMVGQTRVIAIGKGKAKEDTK